MSEAEIHYTLSKNCESVLKFVETFTEGNMTYIVTRLAQGGDLVNYLNNRTEPNLSEDEARNIFAQLVRSVSEMHLNGIVHRDLKQPNIFISGPSAKPVV